MSILELDRKGRLTLPERLRESLGIENKVLVINASDNIKAIPLPSDPFRGTGGSSQPR